jgi:hypothetical protein
MSLLNEVAFSCALPKLSVRDPVRHVTCRSRKDAGKYRFILRKQEAMVKSL